MSATIKELRRLARVLDKRAHYAAELAGAERDPWWWGRCEGRSDAVTILRARARELATKPAPRPARARRKGRNGLH